MSDTATALLSCWAWRLKKQAALITGNISPAIFSSVRVWTEPDFFSMDGINENTAEGYKSILDEEGRFKGYKKNIYCYPPVGTPDGGVYTTAGDLNLFLDAVRKHIILNEKYAEMLLSPHCEFSNTVEWLSIPGLYKKNGYGFEFYLLEEEDMLFCIYKDGSNDGVAAKFLYYPKEDITLTVLSNQDSNIWSMIKKIQVEIYKRYYQP